MKVTYGLKKNYETPTEGLGHITWEQKIWTKFLFLEIKIYYNNKGLVKILLLSFRIILNFEGTTTTKIVSKLH